VRRSEGEELLVPAAAEGADAGAPVRLLEGVTALGAVVRVGGEVAVGECGGGGGKDVEGDRCPEPGGQLAEECAQVL
jgi:hypothetical protein